MNRLAGPLTATRRLLRGRTHAAPEAVVLGYHDVSAPGEERTPLCVSDAALRAHIRCLRAFGFDIVPATEIAERLRRGEPVDGLAALTFDDALVGVRRRAMPVLEDEQAPATVFVVTDALGGPASWWDGADDTLDEDELLDMQGPFMALGSHTRSHRSLPALDCVALRDELEGSRKTITRWTHDEQPLLAYPSGHHDPHVRQMAASAGFGAAFTFLNGRVNGRVDPFRIPRLTMGTHMSVARLSYHLRRSASTWGDHQVDRVQDEPS